MNIADVIAVSGRAGFFNRDLAAVKTGAKADGFAYPGKPVSPGFTRIAQPLLHAAALASYCTISEIVAREYGCDIATAPLPILASCHKEDVQMIDRMILKRVELLPHASFQQVERDIGLRGEKLIAYAK